MSKPYLLPNLKVVLQVGFSIGNFAFEQGLHPLEFGLVGCFVEQSGEVGNACPEQIGGECVVFVVIHDSFEISAEPQVCDGTTGNIDLSGDSACSGDLVQRGHLVAPTQQRTQINVIIAMRGKVVGAFPRLFGTFGPAVTAETVHDAAIDDNG